MTEHAVAQVERHILDSAHRALARLLLRVGTTSELAVTLRGAELESLMAQLADELEATLLPHLAWEEQVCYPAADALAGTPWATRALRIQHEELRERLSALRLAGARTGEESPGRDGSVVKGHLAGLHALLASHIEQEEHALLGLLIEPAPPTGGPGKRPGSLP